MLEKIQERCLPVTETSSERRSVSVLTLYILFMLILGIPALFFLLYLNVATLSFEALGLSPRLVAADISNLKVGEALRVKNIPAMEGVTIMDA